MKMTGRPPSESSIEESTNVAAQNDQTPEATVARGENKSSDTPSVFRRSSTEVDPDYTGAKPSNAKSLPGNDVLDSQTSLRQTFPHLYHSSGTSRSPSTRTSSSSLQALNEDTVVDARSDRNAFARGSLSRRASCMGQSDTQTPEYPVYPDQSYAVLQSQIHPTYHPPFLRTRSSYPTEAVPRTGQSRSSRTAGNTPLSSPGLFSVKTPGLAPSLESDTGADSGTSFLHPTHLQPPKETHTAEVDRDIVTGNKLINQYEILEELGRGEHGKVKLGRHVATRQKVAIKIVQRYSKRRRLGRLGNAEDKVKKEVAILKKARHPNVVSLLEVIDDPNRQKVYIVLEYVENGEIIWRQRGLREIVNADKRRLEREKSGQPETPAFLEEQKSYIRTAARLRRQREKAQARRQAQAEFAQQGPIPAWSLEHGAESDDEFGPELTIARTASRCFPNYEEASASPNHSLPSSQDAFLAAVEGTMYGAYSDFPYEKRRFSTASSSFGYAPSEPDWLPDDDDMTYVPCLTFKEARNAFRDSLLGLEYLHYQGIIHRDIKPANLLVTSNHRVKISDFGVSYLGRPIRDEDEEQVDETDATELDDARELSKTVGTPAFYAPELCYTGEDFVDSLGGPPRITGAIDVWSLGVTLYGMIFGRLPFVSDDEYSMFQTIVKQDVYIPRKRLKPVQVDSNSYSQWPRYTPDSKREEDELAYEDIDEDLWDLLKRLLTKDPVKRITVKEIKHHPWVLHGLPNPRAWVEETDPGYLTKGKKIEVSNEEVTTAVSKVPFIQRVRSNVAKWSNYLTGRSKDRDSRKRTSSTTPSVDSSSTSSSSNTFGKHLWEGRRLSLRGDEDSLSRFGRHNRDGEHPLSQSVTVSPAASFDGHSSSYFTQDPGSVKLSSFDRTPRPEHPERATSTLSTAESSKTVRVSDLAKGFSVSSRPATPAAPEASGTTNISGVFGGASRRLARGLQPGDLRCEKPVSGELSALEGDTHIEPSLALNVASGVGQMQPPYWRADDRSYALPESPASTPGHRRKFSHTLSGRLSVEPLDFTKEDSPRKDGSSSDRYSELEIGDQSCPPEEPRSHAGCVRRDSDFTAGTSIDAVKSGLTTSSASAATMSSSSVDELTSGMSQSTSHPSIPSVMSGASSLSGDGIGKENDSEPPVQVPSILRTGETVKARPPSKSRARDDDESRYYCDDEEESGDESEDEGLVFGKRKPASRKPAIRMGQAAKSGRDAG
ncbi:putative serine/threonine protein kinase [Aspergillus lucknowensis]|uniref:Kinase-like domain-containing protein n=1 Tax=Aspergillus lucknowensis TaxID=176173 RepID=A0ABR4LJA9_9EURO